MRKSEGPTKNISAPAFRVFANSVYLIRLPDSQVRLCQVQIIFGGAVTRIDSPKDPLSP
jgi:hypothetical protein